MTETEPPPKPSDLARENRVLKKKLARLEQTMRHLEGFSNQSASLLRSVMDDLDAERAESERLLLNILPEAIAGRLKTDPGVIADQCDSVSILFADIVGFTPLSETLSAHEMVAWLNEVYSAFDSFVQRHEVEKIRTIGDNYMVASGVPTPRPDHATAITRLALDMRDYVAGLPPIKGRLVEFRVGINSGPVVGGVIGTHKFQYDIWGDAVNTASRMESHGLPGQIQVTADTHELIEDEFVCKPRGAINIKGKGEMKTWFVEGPK